jgi:glycine/D-amino acid oxidase-like deaminating enzyme
MKYDVVIAGGGIMGAAAAVHLLRDEPGLNVVIVEPDPAYALAATPRSSGGIRQLFSCPENIAMSQYTHEIIRNWRTFAGEDAPDLLWRPNGYLFVAGDATWLQANLEIQLAHGVRAEWLDPEDLAPGLAERAGMPVPVEPMRRFEHYAETPLDLSALPFIKDPTGLALRPQGTGISTGLVDFTHSGGFDQTVDHGYFERAVWPALAHRFPHSTGYVCTPPPSACTTRTGWTAT